jgi:hypothetical protein
MHCINMFHVVWLFNREYVSFLIHNVEQILYIPSVISQYTYHVLLFLRFL